MKKKRTFTVKVEFTPDAIPIEKALDSLAKVIARQMYEERHGKKVGEAVKHRKEAGRGGDALY